MKCITCCTVSYNFTKNLRTACFCVLQFFENNDTGTLAHDKAASFFIKRNRTSFRICGRCQRSKRRETTKSCWCNGSFCSACNHNICIRTLDGTICFTDTVGSCRAGSHNIDVFSAKPKLNGDISGCHVGNQKRNHQWIQSAWSFRVKNFAGFLNNLHASDTTSNAASNAKWIFFRHIQSGLLNCLFCRSYCILAEKLHTLCRFKIHIIFCIEVIDFCCHMCSVFT